PTPAGGPCILVLFGASGDLTRRLLVPSLYNLACDGLLPKQFAVVVFAKDELSTDEFRRRMSATLRECTSRQAVDDRVCEGLVRRFHYLPGDFDDPGAYQCLSNMINDEGEGQQTGGNVLFYLATPPSSFGVIAER